MPSRFSPQFNALYSVVIGLHLRSLFSVSAEGVTLQNKDFLWLTGPMYALFWFEWLAQRIDEPQSPTAVRGLLWFLANLLSLTTLSFTFMFMLDPAGRQLATRPTLESPFLWFLLYLASVLLWHKVARTDDSSARSDGYLDWDEIVGLGNWLALFLFGAVWALTSVAAPDANERVTACVAFYVSVRLVLSMVAVAREEISGTTP